MNRHLFISLGLLALLASTGCNDNPYFASEAVEPIAVISGPITGRATDVVEISGAESYDPNASFETAPGIDRYRWELITVPDGSVATIDGGQTADLTTDLPGIYEIQLTVRDENEHLWSVPEEFQIVILPITGFYAELEWTTDVNDVDLHLMDLTQGGGLFDEQFDCHWQNLRPDWGVVDDPTDNPSLSVDDVDGYGPEVAELAVPVLNEQYGFTVHYFSDDGFGPTDAIVRIYFNGILETEMERTLQANEVWDVATVDWTGSTGVLNVVDTLSVY